jgi:aminoglycoside adenylyltransferase-like protein/nucleotidyltransferase-like protein
LRAVVSIEGYGLSLAAVAGPFGHVGTYLHGSVALGGFDPARSDVDVLIVLASGLPATAQAALGERLRGAALPCPGTALECSVITAATAASVVSGFAAECQFEVHVAVSPAEACVMPGAGRDGDPDLILYVEMCRRSAVVAAGPPAAEVFGAVPPERLRAAIVAELEWGLAEAPFHYAVLNACRAMRFAVDSALVSKVAGAEWYLSEFAASAGAVALVRAALAGQHGEPAADPPPDAVAAFVTAARRFVSAS